VPLVVWHGLRDRRTYLPGTFRSIASGLYFASGSPKPALAAFRSRS
jgi:hypothetical protein